MTSSIIVYGNCIFSFFRFVYKALSCTCYLQFIIYKDSSLSSIYITKGILCVFFIFRGFQNKNNFQKP